MAEAWERCWRGGPLTRSLTLRDFFPVAFLSQSMPVPVLSHARPSAIIAEHQQKGLFAVLCSLRNFGLESYLRYTRKATELV